MVDDRVQAKWEDGRMYFGKVTQIFYSKSVLFIIKGTIQWPRACVLGS